MSEVDEDVLRAAVAASTSWRSLLRSIGSSSSSHGRRLRAQCDDAGIDYSHFRQRRWTDDQLVAAVAGAVTWPEVAARLGYAPGSGSAVTTVRGRAARLGLHLEQTQPGAGAYAHPPDPRNLRRAGAHLVAAACALRGFSASWPLEPAVYDLLVDVGSRLDRVQVKTTTWRLNGAWACKISHRRGQQKALYSKQDIDVFGIVDGDQQVYMIPVEAVSGLGTIIVRRYDAYRLR